MKLPAFDTRATIALILVTGFLAAYFRDASPNDIMRGALIGAFAGAWGYYLGSSKGSADKTAAMLPQSQSQSAPPT